MGSNEHGQLGLGFAPDLLSSVKFPTLVSNIIVKKATCGHHHSLAIDQNGFVYGWGQADNGAIGVRVSSSHEPSIIQFTNTQTDVSIKDISCGANHSVFLSTKGEAYSCGKGDKGQLGIGFISIKEYRPIVIRLRDYDEKIQ
jgi:alpha-tubulin suppressor-like RCC1 family protein